MSVVCLSPLREDVQGSLARGKGCPAHVQSDRFSDAASAEAAVFCAGSSRAERRKRASYSAFAGAKRVHVAVLRYQGHRLQQDSLRRAERRAYGINCSVATSERRVSENAGADTVATVSSTRTTANSVIGEYAVGRANTATDFRVHSGVTGTNTIRIEAAA